MDPYLAVLEYLIILSAVALVVMMAAVHAYAPAGKKTYGVVALAFMLAFGVLTMSTHFASITVGRQVVPEIKPLLLEQLSMALWPTVALSIDLLAWDFLLGLSLLFAAPVFEGSGQNRAVRAALQIDGTLCLLGTLGPLSGHMWLQFSGIAGYAFLLPVACLLIARLFGQTANTRPPL